MQLTNFLSESFLTISGFLVFFILLRKLPLPQIFLWGTFVLSISITSFFSALYFAGVEDMNQWHDFFRDIGSSMGIISVVVGAYSLVFQRQVSLRSACIVLIIGLFLMVGFRLFKFAKGFELLPIAGILMMLILGILALKKGLTEVGKYLLLGVLFSVLANIVGLISLPFNQLTAYCVLLSAVLWCFGMAAKSWLIFTKNTIFDNSVD